METKYKFNPTLSLEYYADRMSEIEIDGKFINYCYTRSTGKDYYSSYNKDHPDIKKSLNYMWDKADAWFLDDPSEELPVL